MLLSTEAFYALYDRIFPTLHFCPFQRRTSVTLHSTWAWCYLVDFAMAESWCLQLQLLLPALGCLWDSLWAAWGPGLADRLVVLPCWRGWGWAGWGLGGLPASPLPQQRQAAVPSEEAAKQERPGSLSSRNNTWFLKHGASIISSQEVSQAAKKHTPSQKRRLGGGKSLTLCFLYLWNLPLKFFFFFQNLLEA